MKKFPKAYTVYQIFQGFLMGILAAFASLDKEEPNYIFPLILFAIVFLGSILYAILYRANSGYTLTDTEIIVTRGVLFRKQSRLLLNRIHAVTKRANLIQRMLHICVLHADSGSANTSEDEITLYETEEIAEMLYNSLSAKKQDEVIESKPYAYEFTSKRKIAYAFVENAFVLLIPIFLAVLIGTLARFIPDEGEVVTFSQAVLISVITMLGLYLLLIIIAISSSILRFHRFEVKKTKQSIEVSYGFFTRSTNTFSLKRIRAVELTDNILMRAFGFVSVKLHVIGYLDSGNSKDKGTQVGYLFPLIKRSDVNEALAELLPLFRPSEETTKAKAFFPFISWNLLSLALFDLLAVIGIFIGYSFAEITEWLPIALNVLLGSNVIVLFFLLWDKALAYRFVGFCLEEDTVTLKSGGLSRSTFVIPKRNLTSIVHDTTPLRKKAGILTYVFHFRSNSMYNTVTVPMQDSSYKEKIEAYLPD